jgi:alanine racemase
MSDAAYAHTEPEAPSAGPVPAMTEAVVDLTAIAGNVRLLAEAAGDAEVMAMVNADGFGHGAAPVARAALANGASWLGVALPAEALALRAAGVDAPILAWFCSPDMDFVPLLEARIDIAVSSIDGLESVAAAARRLGYRASVHLKADIGLGRDGEIPQEWAQLFAAARRQQESLAVRIIGLCSHLAAAEDPADPSTAEQLRRFADFRRTARASGVRATFAHLANSAATLQLPEARHDLVRTGIAVYGIEPVPGRVFGRPALTVQARVLLVKRVPADTSGWYRGEILTDRETTLAQIPLGFADGLPRRAAGRGSLLLHGVRVPIVGPVGMDQIVVDAGDLPVRAGDPAVMFGPGDGGEPTAADWARWADTDPHEILTGIGPRVVRRYTP